MSRGDRPLNGFSRPAAVVLGLLALIAAGPAAAHTGAALEGGFVAGFAHPLRGFDHLLAMVAVGIWGAFLGRPLILLLPMVFPTVMAVGGVGGMAGLPFPPVELGIALSVLVLGLAIAFAQRAPVWAACLMVGLFGLFHGFAHGQELPVAGDPLAYSLGFVLATGLLHLAGIALGLLSRYPPGRLALRGAGAAIAAAGGWFVVQALAAA
ncbi:MAG: HupE/UreJ family protein [Caulobacter sp.]|nr:HupE/UreJ family protein [Caulobacter sp.]